MSLGRAKDCKYQCGTLLAWDNEESYFVEVENNNAQHTRERCESLRGNKGTSTDPWILQVKEAVSQDLQMAIYQELQKQTKLLAKIAGEDVQQ